MELLLKTCYLFKCANIIIVRIILSMSIQIRSYLHLNLFSILYIIVLLYTYL